MAVTRPSQGDLDQSQENKRNADHRRQPKQPELSAGKVYGDGRCGCAWACGLCSCGGRGVFRAVISHREGFFIAARLRGSEPVLLRQKVVSFDDYPAYVADTPIFQAM